MDMYTVVRPEHLNHYGSLFGGQMLKWVDEYAYLAAMREFPGIRLVTRAMEKVQFGRSVKNGSLLRFSIERVRIGCTSVTYDVEVYQQNSEDGTEASVFETSITLVRVDRNNQKVPLPPPAENHICKDCGQELG